MLFQCCAGGTCVRGRYVGGKLARADDGGGDNDLGGGDCSEGSIMAGVCFEKLVRGEHAGGTVAEGSFVAGVGLEPYRGILNR